MSDSLPDPSALDGGWARSAFAMLTSLAGTVGVLSVLLLMNAAAKDDTQEKAKTVSSFEIKHRAPPPKSKPNPKPKSRKKARKNPAPLPNLGPSLSGVSFGLPGLGDALADASDSLLGAVSDVVMSEDAVDERPRPKQRTSAPYPARARAKGVEGFVTVSMLVDADGTVKDLSVLASSPPGVFEDATLAALRTWRFEPAQYEGRSVAVRVRQTLRFALE